MDFINICLYIQVTIVVLAIFDCTFAQEPSGVLEVSFGKNPASPGDDVVLRCKVYGDIETQLVGISRYNNNGMNTIIFRNGNLLEDAPEDKFSLEISPDAIDGSINYHVTVSNIDYTSDGGLYTCYVLTVEGSVQDIAISRLDVTEEHLLPKCKSSETGMTFRDQSEITLTCMADGSGVTAQWMRDDQIDISEGQTTIRDGDTAVTTLSHEVSQTDDGVTFICHVVDENRRIDVSRYCSIGPITVTNSTVVVHKIARLSVEIFAAVVTIACLLLITFIILLMLFCKKTRLCHVSPLKRASHMSSKSYSMRVEPGSFTNSTLTRAGTVSGGRETFSYHPSRPAPPPPVTSTLTQQNGIARSSVISSELSNAEALLMATLFKKDKKNSRPDSSVSNSSWSSDEIVYANTDQINILAPIVEDNDYKGVVNPGYEGYNSSAIELSPRKPLLSQSKEIRSNTTKVDSPSSDNNWNDLSGGVGTAESSQIYGNVEISITDPGRPVDSVVKSKMTSNGIPPAPSKPVPMPGLTQSNLNSSPVKPFHLPIQNDTKDLSRPIQPVKPRNQTSPAPINYVPSSQTRPTAPTKLVKTPSMDLDAPLPTPPISLSTPPVSPPTDVVKQLLSSPKRPSINLEAPLPNPPMIPVPPPKPKYDIMSETENRPAPPQKPSYNIMSDTDNRPAPLQKPTYNIMSKTDNRPLPPQKPSYNIMADTSSRPTPPKKPSYDIMSDSRPTPPSNPTHDLVSSSKPTPPSRPVPKPRTNSGGSKPPPPPKKPSYGI